VPIDADSEEREPAPEAIPNSDRILELIRRAFADAKRGGKEDWHLMYAGVLKNRILILTKNQFDESDWDAPGFTALLEFFPELVRVDRTRQPPIVELLHPDQLEEQLIETMPSGGALVPEHPTAERPALDSRRWRIRQDLWGAVLGVRDPNAFVWENGAVVRVPQDEATGHDGPRLPTLTGPELDAWQNEFAAEQSSDSRYASVLKSWARSDIATTALPRQLQHLWYGRLKSLVRTRLEEWFGHHNLSVPEDMIDVPSSGRQRQADDPATELRALVIACVQSMTEDELTVLSLPAAAVLRARR
jgi:hypothetical protein